MVYYKNMKLRRILSSIIAGGVLMVVAGCSPPFPKEMLVQVDRNIVFADLAKDPEAYAGHLVMLGGMIVTTTNLPEGAEIEVLQKPLDSQGRPLATDETGGRFLVLVARFLDAAVYQRGRSLTVIAESAGAKVKPLGEIEYRYPVLKAQDVHLWSPYTGPHFSIGIGVYRGF
jgi:outer membrane lipoprotein